MKIEQRITAFYEAAQEWLADAGGVRSQAEQQTINEGFFSAADVHHAVDAWAGAVNQDRMHAWVERAGLTQLEERGALRAGPARVLCLHAGNLPMVGFQDVAAVFLSGHRYYGKISRKDPYLLPSFLHLLQKRSGAPMTWRLQLDDFRDLRADAVLFSGSSESAGRVGEHLYETGMAGRQTAFLTRTAHFSMAWLPELSEPVIDTLAEAVLRYDGKGCRSVALIVTPEDLRRYSGGLRRALERHQEANYGPQGRPALLDYRHAYNRTVHRDSELMGGRLLQHEGFEFDHDRIIYWTRGGPERVRELAERFAGSLQSVYVPDVQTLEEGIQELSRPVELLEQAQRPPLDWQPDGRDPMAWLAGLYEWSTDEGQAAAPGDRAPES